MQKCMSKLYIMPHLKIIIYSHALCGLATSLHNTQVSQLSVSLDQTSHLVKVPTSFAPIKYGSKKKNRKKSGSQLNV